MKDEDIRIEPKTTRGKLVKRIWGILPALFLIILILVIAGLFAKIRGEAKRLKAEKLAELHLKRPPVNVVVQELLPRTIRDRISLPGVVEPWVRLQIMSEIHGKVIEVSLKEGDMVAKGDVIVRIDPRDYQNVLDSARASYKLAVANRNRSQALFKDELISQSGMDSAKTKVVTLKSAMENAQLQFERCTIKAPISGVINRLDAKVGLLLNVSDPVAELLQIDRVKIVVGIPESDVNDVRSLSHVDLTIDALDGKTVTGEKYFLARSPDTLARLYRLELTVDNRAGDILPGMFARAEIVKKEVTDSIVIPLYAVITRREKQFVYVEENRKVKTRRVELGILDGWHVQILDGLKLGERVIVVGHRSVEEGQEVNVARTITDPRELVE